VSAELSELRAVNVRAIRAARASAAAAGLADGRGYDMLVVPEVRLQPLQSVLLYLPFILYFWKMDLMLDASQLIHGVAAKGL
jgi:hypothetical protein